MKVLLVNPEFPDTYWSFRHALPFEGKRCAYPPLGLLTVSALLPRTWERRLVDLNVRKLRSSDIDWADMVMATAMLVQKDSLKQVLRQCKARGKRVVVGGPYVSTTLEALPDADHIFVGEAETTVPQFLEDLEHGTPQRTYQAPERPPLAVTPVADFHLANMKRYSAMSVQYSRGCPFTASSATSLKSMAAYPALKATRKCWRSSKLCTRSAGAARCLSSTITSSAIKRMSEVFCQSWRPGRSSTTIRSLS